jgi:hypothetical protein
MPTRRLLWMLLFTASAVVAQNGEPKPEDPRLANYAGRPRVRAVRIPEGQRITLDGRLDEPGWSRAIPAGDFIQQDPANGQPATEPTEVRFLFNNDNLYMGVECFDSDPSGMLGNQMLRDGFLPADDRFMWVFDPYLNGRTGYFFEINPGGAMGDALLGGEGGGGGQGRAWDGIWTAKVRKHEGGWTIEMEFPFKTLNFDPNAPAWGVNFQRTVRRKREDMLWTAWIRNQSLQALRNSGLLEGIEGASQGHGLDFRPFFVGNITQSPGQGEPDTLVKGKYGGDIFYNVTPSLRANLTLNTDFAETEVDQRQVNLTQFPLFFPERRAFFLEGNGFFDFSRWQGNNSVVPFFSRRIGLGAGIPQRIEFGTKLTGQIGSYDLGVLHVRTAQQANLVGEDFTVLRPKRRFLRESYVGAMYTRRSERGTTRDDRHTIGGDFYIGTSRFYGNQNLQFSGFYLWTSKDKNNLALKDEGSAHYGVRLDYPNDRYQLRVSMRESQRAYDPSIGFVDRASMRRYDSSAFFRPRPRNPRIVRQYFTGVNVTAVTALDNTVLTRQVNFEPFGVQFQSGDQFQVNLIHTFDRLAFPFIFPTGIRLPTGSSYGYLRAQVSGQTAELRKLAINGTYSNGQFYTGTRRDLSLGLSIRPKPGVFIGLNNEWSRVVLKEGKFSTSISRVNLNWQFTPWISYLNNIQYDNVSRVLGWQSRFRWIVTPGNDIYLVYTHNWLEDVVDGRQTLNRGLATKVTYVKRF